MRLSHTLSHSFSVAAGLAAQVVAQVGPGQLGSGQLGMSSMQPPSEAHLTEVYRDARGVPHIVAASELGAWYALGYEQSGTGFFGSSYHSSFWTNCVGPIMCHDY